MPSAVKLREDYSGRGASGIGSAVQERHQSRRFLSLAGVKDGMNRGAAAKIGAWTGKRCPTGSIVSTPRVRTDSLTTGRRVTSLRLSAEQLPQFAQIVEAGPDRHVDGIVR